MNNRFSNTFHTAYTEMFLCPNGLIYDLSIWVLSSNLSRKSHKYVILEQMLHVAILHVYPLFLSLRMTYHKTGISIFSLQCALSYEHLSFFGHQIRFFRKLSSISSCVVYALLTRARLGIFAAKTVLLTEKRSLELQKVRR